MSDKQGNAYKAFDELLIPQGPVMLVGKQLLKVGSFDDENTEIVFPPSYANPSGKSDDPPVYNIDVLNPSDSSKNVCVLDSIPSQANRMEPLFSEPPHNAIVPQYKLKFNDELPIVNITQIGHRIADAVFRGTTLRNDIVIAFKEYAKGNAKKLAEIGPTSLVFGAWDSRGTGVKVPRLINSIIRAFNVQQLTRSAQYTPPIKYEAEGLLPAGLGGEPAKLGLADVPSPHVIGGVQIFGGIRRDFSLNLELLREIKGADEYETKKLQRYILGLALLAFTATQKTHLRQGCQLLPSGEPTWKLFGANGVESPWGAPKDIAALAHAAATEFGVVQPQNQPMVFDKKRLKESFEADEKAKSDKKSNTTNEAIENLKKLVNNLNPDGSDAFPSGKKDALSILQKEIAKAKKNKKAPDQLKDLVQELESLAIAGVGAEARKARMLALFPAGNDTSATEPTGHSTEDM